MMTTRRIIISTITTGPEGIRLEAELNDSPTAQKIWEVLPVLERVNRWGDEVYLSVPVWMGEESDARRDVDVGDLAFWPLGRTLCIFFGPTPVSTDGRPKAYSPVNIVGRVLSDVSVLKKVEEKTFFIVRPWDPSEDGGTDEATLAMSHSLNDAGFAL